MLGTLQSLVVNSVRSSVAHSTIGLYDGKKENVELSLL